MNILGEQTRFQYGFFCHPAIHSRDPDWIPRINRGMTVTIIFWENIVKNDIQISNINWISVSKYFGGILLLSLVAVGGWQYKEHQSNLKAEAA